MRRAQLGAAVILAGTIAACTDSAPPAGSAYCDVPVAAASPTTTEATAVPEVTTTTTEAPEPVTTTTEAPVLTTVPYRPPTTRRAPVETTEAPRSTQAGPTPPDYIKQCESGGDYRAVNPAGYYGAWQFSLPTWRSVGGTGNPADASPAEQDYRASLLWANGAGAHHWECA